MTFLRLGPSRCGGRWDRGPAIGWARESARSGSHTSGSEARKHQGLDRWLRRNPRFRPGEAYLERARRRVPPKYEDGARNKPGISARHGGLHVAGAGERRTRRFSIRPVFVWCRSLRDAHRPTGVRAADHCRDALSDYSRRDAGIAQLNPAVPPPVRWIVERCLAKDADERYALTRDLARDLASAGEHLTELLASRRGRPMKRMAGDSSLPCCRWSVFRSAGSRMRSPMP